MFTFTTFAGAAGTLIVSGVADKVLRHYGKSNLAETLGYMTHGGAYMYGAYLVVKLLTEAARIFL